MSLVQRFWFANFSSTSAPTSFPKKYNVLYVLFVLLLFSINSLCTVLGFKRNTEHLRSGSSEHETVREQIGISEAENLILKEILEILCPRFPNNAGSSSKRFLFPPRFLFPHRQRGHLHTLALIVESPFYGGRYILEPQQTRSLSVFRIV